MSLAQRAENVPLRPHVPPFPEIEIVARTPDYVVVNKPSGLLSVPGRGEHKWDCVTTRVQANFSDATGAITVHRLDMDTSGLLVCALTVAAQRALSIQFQNRVVEKSYVALVDGIVPHESGSVTLPMRLDVDNRPVQIVDHEQGKPCHTDWRVLSYETDRTRLALLPVTGRTHQLRVHCAHIMGEESQGYPILGDAFYGNEDSASRLMLHAKVLSFLGLHSPKRVTYSTETPF